jgi:hypothetical protein
MAAGALGCFNIAAARAATASIGAEAGGAVATERETGCGITIPGIIGNVATRAAAVSALLSVGELIGSETEEAVWPNFHSSTAEYG